MFSKTLRWRHNEHDSVSNHQPHDCLLNRLFGRKSKKTSKLRVTGFCAGNSPGTGEFPAQRASNAENVSIWWRHHGYMPLISKPTEETHRAATVIDNIFTNTYNTENKHLTANLTTDISNHYMIFHIAPSHIRQQEDHHQLIKLPNSPNLKYVIYHCISVS